MNIDPKTVKKLNNIAAQNKVEKVKEKQELKNKFFQVNKDISADCNLWLHQMVYHYCQYFGYDYYADCKTKHHMVAVKEYKEQVEVKTKRHITKNNTWRVHKYNQVNYVLKVTNLLVNYYYSAKKCQWSITIHGYKDKECKEYQYIDVMKEINVITLLKRFENGHIKIF